MDVESEGPEGIVVGMSYALVLETVLLSVQTQTAASSAAPLDQLGRRLAGYTLDIGSALCYESRGGATALGKLRLGGLLQVVGLVRKREGRSNGWRSRFRGYTACCRRDEQLWRNGSHCVLVMR